MKKTGILITILTLLSSLTAQTLHAALTNIVAEADTFIRSGVSAGSATDLDVYGLGGNDRIAYIRFDLSSLRYTEILSATLKLHETAGSRNDYITTGRHEVYGLTDSPGNTPQNWNESTDLNPGNEYDNTGGNDIDPSVVFVLDPEQGADVTETVPGIDDVTVTTTGPDLVTFLNQRLSGSGLVTFIVAIDSDNRGYGFASRENTTKTPPTFSLQTTAIADPYPETPVRFSRQAEDLNRGVVAVRQSSLSVYIGWRMLGTDATDIAFNLYRDSGGGPVKLNASPITQTTDYVDVTANLSLANSYFVRPVVDGVEQADSETFTLPAGAPIRQFLEIPLQIPPSVQTPDGVWHDYTANDASVGDLDGDGDYEIVLKWIGEPADLYELSANMYVDAYDLDGTRLWRIDVGPNVKTIASSLQFVVYDLDGDGRAEVAMNTSDGAVSGTGEVIGNPGADWRNSDGWITTGPEFLTIFNGVDGSILTNAPLQPARVDVSDWGDDYGHRSTTHNYVVAYLDGRRPSLVLGRGIYHGWTGYSSKHEMVAWDWRDGQLTQRWKFTATEGTGSDVNPDYVGQGNHNASVADVDGDGYDEIIWGAMAVDHDGTGLYSTGRGHGDALHVSDMDPDNPGLEIFSPHESVSEYGDAGGNYRDAMTGETLIGIPANNDVGRGVAFDIDANHPGYEFWATATDPDGGARMIYNVQDGPLYETPANMFYNFGVWWDADPLRELLDQTTISKWNYQWTSPGRSNYDLDPATGGTQQYAPDCSSNNGTKATPALSGDILGDWREEVIWRKSDNSALRIFTTIIRADSRMPTLMHDIQYREAIAWQNNYYNQPPHPSFFLGAGMDAAPTPQIYLAGPAEPIELSILNNMISFDSVSSWAYSIETNANLSDGEWQAFTNIVADEANTQVEIPTITPTLYFRGERQ